MSDPSDPRSSPPAAGSRATWRPTVRPATEADVPFLEDMLLEAIFVADGGPRPGADALADPHLAGYVAGFGRPGDAGVVAVDATGAPIGAAWVRLPDPAAPGYGTVDLATPELTIAVVADHRGTGVGSTLLASVLASTDRCSLSVDARNPAIRLYERFGFVPVDQSGTSITMLRR